MARTRRDFGVGGNWVGGMMPVLSTQAKTFVLLGVPSLVIAMIAVLAVIVWHPNDRLFAILAGPITAAISVLSTAFILSAMGWAGRRLVGGKFIEFFGQVTAQTRGALLVFAERRAVDPAKLFWIVRQNAPGAKDATPKGITDWFPAQDLRGANYVAGELAKHTGQTAYYRTDTDLLGDPIDQIRATVFSFGLGFNQFTHRLVNCTEGKLFNVVFSQQIGEDKSDHIHIPGLGLLEPHSGIDYSVVVRIAHAAVANPTRYYFVCAGRTATGTAVAGRFLAARWEEMLEMYKEDAKDLRKDSLLLVICHRYMPPPDAGEEDYGEIGKWQGKKFRLWWPRENAEPEVRIVANPMSIDKIAPKPDVSNGIGGRSGIQIVGGQTASKIDDNGSDATQGG